MGRKKLPDGEKLEILTIWIEGKYLKGQDKDELRAVAHKSVVEYVECGREINNDLNQTKCRKCNKELWLRDEDAGTSKEELRLCDKCINKTS